MRTCTCEMARLRPGARARMRPSGGAPPIRPLLAYQAGTQEVAADKAGNLLNKIPICIEARVMLTCNLWQPCGLVNGAQGYIFDLGWAPGADWQRDLPCIIIVIFDKYTGPAFITTDDGRKVVSILPVKTEFLKGLETCSRTQFPLHILYVIMVYKS